MYANTKRLLLSSAMLAAVTLPALAADPYEPPVIEAPYEEPVIHQKPDLGGWYIRGDVDYHWTKWNGGDYITYGPPPGTNSFSTGELDGAWSLGAGVGYQMNEYFRADLTADYFFKSDFRGSTCGPGGCGAASSDSTGVSAWLLLANAYAELGTWHRITPYIGAGIGGAHLKWDSLRNTIGGTTTVHEGAKGWRFAYALMAGASYCITPDLSFDLGYRYSQITGGAMFGYAPATGPGFHKDLDVHEVRAGLRYQFGGPVKSGCGEEVIAYDPPPMEPVYK